MVSGKPSNQSALQVDSSPTTRLLFYVYMHRLWEYVLQSRREYGHVVTLQTYVLHIGCAYGPTVACGGFVPRHGLKGKQLLRNYRWMFQACELGLPWKGWKFDSESSASHEDWDCLTLWPHRVTRKSLWGVILMYALKRLYHAWVVTGAYL
jgi:hypothetical protein